MNELMTRREKSVARIDGFPPELRECVHEFGNAIVDACLQARVTKPAMIRELVLQIWAGARQEGQRGGAEGTLDWVLMQAGANITAARLERILWDFDLRIVSVTPSHEMLQASMAEVSGFNERITKTEKHRRRLMAAIRACKPRFRMRSEKAA